MDFHSMKRRELQELCKNHGIPANLSTAEMAARLASSFQEVEKEKPSTRGSGRGRGRGRGRSCLKEVEQDVCDLASDGENRKAKKVRFSPENELIEFTKSIAPRRRGRPLKRNSISAVDYVCSGELKQAVPKSIPFRVTRSRGLQLWDVGDDENNKVTKSGLSCDDRVEEVSSLSDNEVREPTRRALRKRGMQNEELDKNVGDIQGLRMSPRKRTRGSAKGIANVPQSQQSIEKLQSAFKRSVRNAAQKENAGLVNEDVGKHEKYNVDAPVVEIDEVKSVEKGAELVTAVDKKTRVVTQRSLRNREVMVEGKIVREDDNAVLRRGRHIKKGLLVNNQALQTQDIVEEPKKGFLRKSKRNVSQGKDTVPLDEKKNIGKARSLRNREIIVEEKTERDDDNAGLRGGTGRPIKQGLLVNNEAVQSQDIVEEPKKVSLRKSKRNVSQGKDTVTPDGNKNNGKMRSLRNRVITVEENIEREHDQAGLKSERHIKQAPVVNNEVLQTQDIVEEPKKESLRKSKRNISHEDNVVTLNGHKSIGKARSLRNREITVQEKTEGDPDNAGLRSGKHIKRGPLVNNEVVQTQDIVEEHKKKSLRKSKKSILHEDNAVILDGHKSSVKVRSLRNREITVEEKTEREDDNAGLRSEKHIKQGPLVNNEVMQTQDIVDEHKKESLRKSKKSISHEDNAVTPDGHKSIGKVRSLRNREITVEEKTERKDDNAGLRSGRHIKQGPLVDNEVLPTQEILEEPKKELLRSKSNVSYGDNTATTSGNKNTGKVRRGRNHISLALNTSNSKLESAATKAAADSSVSTTVSEDVNKGLMKMGGPLTEGDMEPLEEGPQKELIGDEANKTLRRSKRNSAKMDDSEYLHIRANSEFTSKSSEHDHSVAEDMGTSRRNSGHNHVNSCDRTERIHNPTVNHAVEKESCVKHPSVEISLEQLKANAARDYKSVPPVGNEHDAGNKSSANPDCMIDEFSLGKNEPEQKSQLSPHKSGDGAGEVEEVNTPHFDTGVENSCSDLVDLHIENEVQTMSVPITESHGFEEMGNSPMNVNVENPLDDLVVASFSEQEPSAYFNVDRDSASVEASSRVDMHTSNGQSYSTGGVKEMLREELIKDDHAESESKEEISMENELVLDAAPLNKIDGVNLATKFSLTEDTKGNNNKFLHIGDCSQVKYILNEPVNPESCIHNAALTGSKSEESSQQHKLASSPKVDSRKNVEVQSPRLVSSVGESCSEMATPHYDHVEHEKAIVNELKVLSDIANISSEENTRKSLDGLIDDDTLFHRKTYDGINVRDAVTSEIHSPTNALGCITQTDLTADVKEGQSGVAEVHHAGSLSKHKGSTSQDEQTLKDEQELCTIEAESVSSFATVTVSNDLLQDTLDDRPEDNLESFIHNTAMTENKFEDSSQQHKLLSSPEVDNRKKMEVQSPQFESAVEEPCSVVVTSQFDLVEHPKVIENELKDFSYIANIHSEENTCKSLEGLMGDNLFHCKTYDDINVARDAGTSEIKSPTNPIGCIAHLDLTDDVKEKQSEGVVEFQLAGSLSKHKGSTSQDEQTVKDEQETCTIAAESVSSFAAVTVSNDLLQDSLDDIPEDNSESFVQNIAMTRNKFEESSMQPKLASSPKIEGREKMEVQSPRLVSAVEESCSEVVISHFDHEEQKKVIANESKDLSCIDSIPSEENTSKSLEGLIGDNLFHCKTYEDINITRDAVTSEINSPTNALGCIAQLDMTADVKEGQSEGVAEFQHAGPLSKHKGSTSQDEQIVKDEQQCTIAAESVSSFAIVTVSNDLLQDTLDDRPADNPESFIHNTAITGNKFEDSSQQHKPVSSPKVDSRKKMEVQSPQFESAVEEPCSLVVTSQFDHAEHPKVIENEIKDFSYIANIHSEENTFKSLEGLVGNNLFHCKTYDDINVGRDAGISEINSPTNAIGGIAHPDLTANVKEGLSEGVAEFQHAGSLSKDKGSTSQDGHTVKEEQEPRTIAAENLSSFASGTVSNDLLQDSLDDTPADNPESFLQNTSMTGKKIEESSLQPKLASSPKVDSRKKMGVQSPQLVSAVEESCSEVVTSHFDHEEQKENTSKSLEGLIGDNLFHCKTYDDINVTRDAVMSEINSPTKSLGCIAQLDITADVKEGQSEGVTEFQHAGSLSKHKGSTSQDEQTVKEKQELCSIAPESISSFATVIVSNDILQDRLDHGPVEYLEDGSIRFEDAGLVRSSQNHDYEVSIPDDHAVDAGNLENISTVYLSTTEQFSPVVDEEHANDVYGMTSVELGEELPSISRQNVEHAFAKGDRIPKEEDLVGEVNVPNNDEKPLEYSATDRRDETILQVTCINGEEVQYVDDTLHHMLALKDGKEPRDEVQEKDLRWNTYKDEISEFSESSGTHDNFPCLLSTPFEHKCEVVEAKDAETVGRENNFDDAISNLEVDYSLEASHEVCEEPNIRSEAVLAPWGSFHGDISRELNISTVEKRSEEDYTVKNSTSIFPCAERPDAESATLSSPKSNFTLGGNTEGQKLQVENTSTTSTSNIENDENTKGCPTAMANDPELVTDSNTFFTSPSKLLAIFEEIDKSAPINDEHCSKSNKCTSADEDSHGTTITTFDHPFTVADMSQQGPCQFVEPEASNSTPLNANEGCDPSTECRAKAAEMESHISRPTYERTEDIDSDVDKGYSPC